MYLEKNVLNVSLDDNDHLSNVKFSLNANKVSKNSATLLFSGENMIPPMLDHYRSLVEIYHLSDDDIVLKEGRIGILSTQDGLYNVGDHFPYCFLFLEKNRTIRESLDGICEKGFLSSEDRYHVESSLIKYEKALEFSRKRTTGVTEAQKDVISSFVEPYIPDLRRFGTVKNNLDYITSLTTVWSHVYFEETNNPSRVLMLLRNYMRPIPEDDEFLESLIAVTRVVAGYSNLETALLQCGSTLPNEETILNIIQQQLEAF